MPTYAPVSSTVVQTPSILATLNEYLNETLIPQGWVQKAFVGSIFGEVTGGDLGLENRPSVKLPSFPRAKKHTGEGTQAEMILNFETSGNMQAFYDLGSLNVGIHQGGTKIFTPWAHYSTHVMMARTQKVENSGSGKQYDILKSMLEQKTRNAFNKLETDALSTNTDINHSTSQDELVGVRHWNSTSPSTGTQHGLARDTYTPFRNQTATITSFAASGLDGMQSFFYTTAGTNGNEPVSVIWMNHTIHGYMVKQLQAVHRVVGSLNGADMGVSSTVPFCGIPTVWHPSWPASRQDWINNNWLHAFILAGCNWDSEDPGKPNNVAVAYERRWYFTCALMHARPETNGVITVSGA